MTRHWTGETDDPLVYGRYNAALRSALQGRRGQQLLRDLIAGLEALPTPELEAKFLAHRTTGCVCAFGAVGLQRGLTFEQLVSLERDDNPSPERLAGLFNVADTLANELVHLNDESVGTCNKPETRQRRWRHVHAWAKSHLLSSSTPS